MLKRDTVQSGDICKNCVRELSPDEDKSVYICLKDNCFYGLIANQMYYICDQCYNVNDEVNGHMDKIEFICNKVLSSINTISYV